MQPEILADLVSLHIGALLMALIIGPILLVDKIFYDAPIGFENLIGVQNDVGINPVV